MFELLVGICTPLIIYCNTCATAETIAQCLRDDRDIEDSCVAIHSRLSMEERNLRLRAFRSGSARYLVSTDLMHDMQSVPVVNYEMPNDLELYLQRSGHSITSGGLVEESLPSLW